MAKQAISLSSKLSNDKPSIEINGKEYEINNSLEAVMAFEDMAGGGTKSMMTALENVLGTEAFEEIGIRKLSIANFKVVMVGIMAAMQECTYEVAEKRFLNQLG